MSTAYITNTASFLPNAPVSNDDMERILGTVRGKASRARRTVLRSNGITERYYAIDPDSGRNTHNNAQLTAAAIRKLDTATIDCLVTGTSIPDQMLPSHASMVHGELGIAPCESVSTSGVCLSGIMALKYAWMSVTSGQSRHAVASGSENVSSLLRGNLFEDEVEARVKALQKRPEVAFEKDFLRWMLSDGAGAVSIQPRPDPERLSLKIDWIISRSFANEMDACMYAGAEKLEDGSLKGWRDYPVAAWGDQSIFSIKQDVKQLNQHIIHYTVDTMLEIVMRETGIRATDIDWYLPHYSSHYFRDRVAEGMRRVDFEIPFERWFSNLYTTGNTGSASMFIMLDELVRSGKLEADQKLLCYIPESGRVSSAFMLLTVCDSQSA